MTDKPSNYELDDELLSAYLDGELSADERAAVEARLATDPAAQQLLHELRSVSQSVQALPTESLGGDLSEEILRRARQAKPEQGTATADAAPMPSIRVFHSKRAWIWASMAIAAGLLIMIVQSGDDAKNKLPAVAVRDEGGTQAEPADGMAVSRSRELTISAPPQSQSPPPAAVASSETKQKLDALSEAAAPAAPAGAGGGQLSKSLADVPSPKVPLSAASPAPMPREEAMRAVAKSDDVSNLPVAAPGQSGNDRFAAPDASGRIGGASGAPVLAADKKKSEAIVNQNAQRFTVVNVVAKPEALKNRSFERLLVSNKIEFVPTPASGQALGFGGGKLAKPAQGKLEAEDRSKKSGAAEAEVVLVEAPAPAVESYLADLNKNSNDYVSITVSEAPPSGDRVDAKAVPAEKLAESQAGLTRFSRGATPLAQKDTTDLHRYYESYDFQSSTVPATNGSQPVGGLSTKSNVASNAESDANGDKRWYKGRQLSDVRRARGVQSWDFDKVTDESRAQNRAATGPGGAPSLQPSKPQRAPTQDAVTKTSNQGDELKVLFVFMPEESPAASAPSASPAK